MIFNAAKELGQLSKLKVRKQRIPGTDQDTKSLFSAWTHLQMPLTVLERGSRVQLEWSFDPQHGNSRPTISKPGSALPT